MKVKADADPVLIEASNEIKEILKKHDIAGVVHLFSPTHGEFLYHLEEPSWSCLSIDGKHVRIKAKCVTGGPDETARLEATVHMLAGARDLATNTFGVSDGLLKALKKHVDIDMGEPRFVSRKTE